MPGHPAGDRVDRVLHVDAALLEELGQLADRVLGLRDREAVARARRSRAGRRRAGSRRRRRRSRGREPPARRRRPAASSPPPNPPIMMFMTERFIASAMSLVRIAPEAPTRAPAMIRTGLSMHEAGHRHGRAGERVQERDDDRHVGAADRQRHRHAEDQRRGEDDQHHRARSACRSRTGRRAATTVTAARASGHELAAGDEDRLAGDQALELARGDERAGERDRADDDVEDDEDVACRAGRRSPATRGRR